MLAANLSLMFTGARQKPMLTRLLDVGVQIDASEAISIRRHCWALKLDLDAAQSSLRPFGCQYSPA